MEKNKTVKTRENEELWIDYLEGELETSLKEDMDLQLKNDPQAQKLVGDYKSLRSNIKALDSLPKSLNPEAFRSFHSKVMEQVSGRRILQKSSFWQSHPTRSKLMAIAAVFLLILGGLFAWHILEEQVLESEAEMATESGWLLEKPIDESSLIVDPTDLDQTDSTKK